MTIVEYLSQYREECPKWLREYNAGDRINVKDFLSSRVLYYPGSLFDGQPIKTCNQAHYAHSYIYADYGVTKEASEEEFNRGFRGYHMIGLQYVSEKEITPTWTPHVQLTRAEMSRMSRFASWIEKPFCQISVFERDKWYDDSHGCKRFAVMYLCADGIATYDAIFGNGYNKEFSLVLQDHSFGCNYDKFGHGGIMERIAVNTNAYPKYILCAENTDIWPDYGKLDLNPVQGGMHRMSRYLYKYEK